MVTSFRIDHREGRSWVPLVSSLPNERVGDGEPHEMFVDGDRS